MSRKANSLSAALGFEPEERVVIIHCDDPFERKILETSTRRQQI